MLGDDIRAALPGARAHAESLMRDTCRIERARLDEDGNPVREMDEDLQYVNVYDEVHVGPCRIQRPGTSQAQDASAGEFEYGLQTLLAQLPLDAVGIKRGDRLTVTALGPFSDPDLLGVVATVGANATKSHPTKRTLICEEVS
jgi:hypothetical protein